MKIIPIFVKSKKMENMEFIDNLMEKLKKEKHYNRRIERLLDSISTNPNFSDIDYDTFIRALDRVILKTGDKRKLIEDFLIKMIEKIDLRGKDENSVVIDDCDSMGLDDVVKSKISKKKFIKEKIPLQIELLKVQEWVKKNNIKFVVVFEGRDSAGKGSIIKVMTEYLDPKFFNVVALGIPTEEEKKDWFSRYSKCIKKGKITFFDRSWYNRAVVEPVMGYSTEDEYKDFMKNVNKFESGLLKSGVIIFKFWLSITKETQEKRFKGRQMSPLKYWKYSPNDAAITNKWEEITKYKEKMIKRTNKASSWIIVDSNDKRVSALNTMRYLLNKTDYSGKNIEACQLKYPEVITTVGVKK
jgi:polyphosphate kinase 2